MKTIYTIIFFFFVVSNSVFSQINLDENLVPEYTLPKILLSDKGKEIKTIKHWETIRRPEILNLFKKQIYGEYSDSGITTLFKVTSVDETALCNTAIRKTVAICFIKAQDTIKADLLIYLPISSTKKPTPLFLGLNFFGNHTIHYDKGIPLTKSYVSTKPEIHVFEHSASELSRGVRAYRWPIERIIERGYGLATIYYGDIDPDFDDQFKNGIHKLMESPKTNETDSRSAISAWAFALSKAMDYFVIDNQINQNQIAVLGHSRLGKAALWAGATDDRFAITISNNSGCGGAALSRRKYGETVEKINTSFPHWFCENFNEFNNNEDTLPVDQHMLLSLIAPRGLYVASAEEDKWADPKGEFLSLYHSSETYKLYGLDYFQEDTLPELNKSITKGHMGYHIRSGVHELLRFDWEAYLDFADTFFSNQTNINIKP